MVMMVLSLRLLVLLFIFHPYWHLIINDFFPVGFAAVVNYCWLVRLLFCKSARRITSQSIKMDSGPERRGQLKTQHGSPVLVHERLVRMALPQVHAEMNTAIGADV